MARQPVRHDITSVAEVVAFINANLPHYEWMRALMGIFYETFGSEEGFDLANAWSSERKDYCGTQRLRAYWRKFKVNPPNPIRIGTLVWLAKKYPRD